MSFHVLVPDNVNQTAIDILRNCDEIRVSAPGKLERPALLDAAPASASTMSISRRPAPRALWS